MNLPRLSINALIAALVFFAGCAKESAPQIPTASSPPPSTIQLAMASDEHAPTSPPAPKKEMWEIKTLTDAMTDEISHQAVLTSHSGDTLTLLLRGKNKFWAFVQLAGANQFGIDTDLTIRIDANKPGLWDDSWDKLSRMIGKDPTHTWEWNPSLIGFEAGSYATKEGEENVCSFVRDLYGAKKIVIRYHPNKSTFKDIEFHSEGNQSIIIDAFHINLDTCERVKA